MGLPLLQAFKTLSLFSSLSSSFTFEPKKKKNTRRVGIQFSNMASRRASRLSKSLIGAGASTLSRSQPRSVRALSSSIIATNSVPSPSRPQIFGPVVSDNNVASAKFLANTFTRHFHSSTPSFYSATTSSSQVPTHTITQYLPSLFIYAFLFFILVIE